MFVLIYTLILTMVWCFILSILFCDINLHTVLYVNTVSRDFGDLLMLSKESLQGAVSGAFIKLTDSKLFFLPTIVKREGYYGEEGLK